MHHGEGSAPTAHCTRKIFSPALHEATRQRRARIGNNSEKKPGVNGEIFNKGVSKRSPVAYFTVRSTAEGRSATDIN